MPFPAYKQLDAMDCGPTCIRIISKYYGKEFSLQFLREKAFPTRKGISLYAISSGAEELGFRTKGYKLEVEALKEIDLPAIVHWKQNHFVVLYKIDRKSNFYISNSGAGARYL
ncbi:MAG: hypothetical protein JW870_21535 [Candidatus Delongbacteria bacterium]|nr:hypothetical protein [Candidatus Delongbacteria bacterium]